MLCGRGDDYDLPARHAEAWNRDHQSSGPDMNGVSFRFPLTGTTERQESFRCQLRTAPMLRIRRLYGRGRTFKETVRVFLNRRRYRPCVVFL
jgi:hypothetical protein